MSDYLVIGSAGGMGKSVTRLLLDGGHTVWGIDISGICFTGSNYRHITADIRKTDELRRACDIISKQTDSIDGIIFLAGIYDLNSLVEISEDDFTRDFDINVFGAYRVNRIFVPLIKNGGRIIIVSSELAPLNPLPFTGIYAVTKAALDKYAAALRMELQLTGIKVIVVRPGAVKTDMLPTSVKHLSEFCERTERYTCNAKRFRKIVEKVEARNIPADKIAKLVYKILKRKNPRPVYSINRNPLLLIYSSLPVKIRLWLIRTILSE